MSEITADAERRIAELGCWSGSPDIEPLKGGLSNESYVVTDAGRKAVVRFGRDFPFHHVFREREAMVARAAHGAGLAPEVIHSGDGVLVSAFVDGRTFGPEDVRADADRIADLVKRFHHALPGLVSGPGFMFWVFHVIRDYARTLMNGGSRATHLVPQFVALAAEFEAAQFPMPIIFGHNDLLPANIIDDGEKLWLIDFEYAGFNTAMFDLAGLASNAEFSTEAADALLARYFGNEPTAKYREALAAMQCASLLRETMWSLVSELHLSAPGVDYEAYTQETVEKLEKAIAAYREAWGKT